MMTCVCVALPVVAIQPHARRVAVGGSVTLRCTARNAFLVHWNFRGRRVQVSTSRVEVTTKQGTFPESTIKIKDIQRGDSGTYTCKAFVQVATANKTTKITAECEISCLLLTCLLSKL